MPLETPPTEGRPVFPDATPTHEPARLLVAVAHPDDETFGCGSVLLAAHAAGWETTVLCATRGEAGEPAPGTDLDGTTLGAVREAELREAARILHVDSVHLLDLRDSGMEGDAPAGSLSAAAEDDVVAAVRRVAAQVEPDVIVTLDAGDGHRDHAAMRDAAIAVGRETQVPVFLQCLPRSLMDRWVAHMVEQQPDLVYLRQAELGTPDDQITVELDSSPYLAERERAIAAHTSQTAPFAGLPHDLYRDFLTRDHLLRAR